MKFTIKNIAVHTFWFWVFRNIYSSPIAVKIFVMFFRIVTMAIFMYFKLKRKMCTRKYQSNMNVRQNINQTVGDHNWSTKKFQFIAYLYMPDISIPMNIKLTGIQTLISFQLSFSTETARQRPNTTTTRELIRFCLTLYEK